MLPNVPYGLNITTGWEPLIPQKEEMPLQRKSWGVLSYANMRPCLRNVECQGNKADKGTSSGLSILLVGLGVVFFQASTSSALLPLFCPLCLHWLLLFILFLILSPFCLYVPLAFQLFFWNLYFPDPVLLFSLRNKNLVPLITTSLPLCQTALRAEAAGQPTEKVAYREGWIRCLLLTPQLGPGRKGSLGIKHGYQAIE